MQWYTALPADQQAALQGLVVMLVFAAVKAACHYAGKPLGDTAAAKVGKLLTVAVATAATTLATVGATPQFWMSWALAIGTAIGSWEVIAKGFAVATTATTEDTK